MTGSLAPATPGVDLDPGNRQLGQFIRVDLGFTVVSALVVAALWIPLPPSPAYPLVVALPTGAAALMAMAPRALRRGDAAAAVGWMSLANWGVALAASLVVTFLWPLMLLVAVLPCFLAVSFLRGERIRVWLAVSLAVALGVTALGLLQDVTGFSADVPLAVRHAMLIVVTPVIAALVVVVSLANSRGLQRALEVAVASRVALEDQAEELRASRARVVAAADRERQRIERDLHDGAQQRLVAIKLHLSRAASQCGTDPASAGATLDMIREEVGAAHRELRDLAQGVYPPVLVEHGLGEALGAAADRCAVPVVVDLPHPFPRFDPRSEAALYFCAVEAMANAAKHGGPEVRVHLSAGVAGDPAEAWFEVADDGVGFDPSTVVAGTGLQNLRDRLGAAGGGLALSGAHGDGATIRGAIPVSGRVGHAATQASSNAIRATVQGLG